MARAEIERLCDLSTTTQARIAFATNGYRWLNVIGSLALRLPVSLLGRSQYRLFVPARERFGSGYAGCCRFDVKGHPPSCGLNASEAKGPVPGPWSRHGP